MLNKYQVTETIDWEGVNLWTVLAKTPEEAKAYVTKHSLYGGEKLSITILKYDVRGTIKEGVFKYTSRSYE